MQYFPDNKSHWSTHFRSLHSSKISAVSGTKYGIVSEAQGNDPKHTSNELLQET